MKPAAAIYLATEPDPVFAVFHPAAEAEPRAAVLICPPWGWEEVASYRSRREWAERLAAAGHPTLRLTLPATGNSAGSPRDPGRVDAWTAAINGAARWLREASGAPRLAVLGLGLGGLLARAALAAGTPIDGLVLWGAPASGRAFARETRAFSLLQDWHGGDREETAGEGLPEGWLEAGGFVLSAETLADLRALKPQVPADSPLRRALLLERDGVAVDEGLRDDLLAAGVAVETAPGVGWGELVSDIELAQLESATAKRVDDWLGEADADGSAAAASGPAPARLEEIVIATGGRRLRERPLSLPGEPGGVFAMLTEPAEGPEPDLCAVFFNAGAVANVGPDRLWVETARRWAGRGVRSVRLDLEGLGEAGGEQPRTIEGFYLPRFGEQVDRVLRELRELGLGERLVTVGLCAGGYWAFRTALGEHGVESAILLDAGALVWEDDLLAQRREQRFRRASDRRWWGRVLRGEVSPAQLLGAVRSALAGLVRGLRPSRRRYGSRREQIERDFDRLGERGTQLTLGLCEGEPLLEELRFYRLLDLERRWLGLALADLPGGDHTLRPVPAQAAAGALLDASLERALGRPGGVPQEAARVPAGRPR